MQSFGVAEVGRVPPAAGLPHIADASQLSDVVADVGCSIQLAEACQCAVGFGLPGTGAKPSVDLNGT
jgi:hypothetical protein